MSTRRRLEWDWYPGEIPGNVTLHESSYVETSFSFHQFRSELPDAVSYGRGASSYLGTMFDVGPRGKVVIGEFALLHGVQIICDAEIAIGDYALISWNVVLMDTYRFSASPVARRRELEALAARSPRLPCGTVAARPIRIESNVWIGFESCILPGVTIGHGSVVGARSVVTESVPAYTVVGGNPARVIRELAPHP